MKRYLAGIMLLLTAGCTNYNEEELYGKTDPACQVGDVSYLAHVKPILVRECYGCHAAAFKSGNVDLETYAELAEVADDRLLPAINHAPGYAAMPKGGSKLPACDIAKITKWVEAGAPNN